jgi:hypothetical protein
MSTKLINSSQKNKQAYIDYLETFSWTYFFTATTRYDLSIKSNRRLMERFYDRFKTPDTILFYCAEPFDIKVSCHDHGLVKIPNDCEDLDPDGGIQWRQLINHFQAAAGNKVKEIKDGIIVWDKKDWCSLHLRKYNPKMGAAGYCGKYIFKKDSDYNLFIGQDAGMSVCDVTEYDYCPGNECKNNQPYRVEIPLSWLCRSATMTRGDRLMHSS